MKKLLHMNVSDIVQNLCCLVFMFFLLLQCVNCLLIIDVTFHVELLYVAYGC